MADHMTRTAAVLWAVLGVAVASLVLLAAVEAGSGSRRPPPHSAGEERKGEAETRALLQAMEDAVAVKDGDRAALLDALRRVAAADRALGDLHLTTAERQALDGPFAARRADLQAQLEAGE